MNTFIYFYFRRILGGLPAELREPVGEAGGGDRDHLQQRGAAGEVDQGERQEGRDPCQSGEH